MKEIYDWVEWFKELAQVVEEIGENGLIEKAKRIDWGPVSDGKPFRLLNPDYGDQNIDPLSFFYTLAMRNSTNYRSIVYKSVKKELNLGSPLPSLRMDQLEKTWIFPTPRADANTLFHTKGEGDPSLMWKLFRDARKGFNHIQPSDFNDALAVKGINRKKLTQTLFLINPEEFVPYDSTMVPLVPEIEPEPFEFEKYRQVLKNLQAAFPGCDFNEINLFAFWRENVLKNSERKFYQVSTRVYGPNDEDRWVEFSENNWVRTGGPKSNERVYKALPKIRPGDIVLVRSGMEGRGIGIVHQNKYKDDFLQNWDDKARIHVVWINKEKGSLENSAYTAIAISEAFALCDTFQNSPVYSMTFRIIGEETKGRKYDDGKKPIPEDTLKSLAIKLFLPVKFLKNINALLERKRQVIFQGPPGTGKTYIAQELANHLAGNGGHWEIVQFHPSYSYEDFVRGYRPTLINGKPTFKLKDGPLLLIASQAAEADKNHKFILIIDEINRGNLAKVLGELYFLLEYRDRDIELMYQRDGERRFRLPPNLYIIGTMNTADRSIALVDLALRRRFAFVEFDPHMEPIRGLLNRWMQSKNPGRFEWLVDLVASANDKLKDHGAAIGPSYFMREHIDDEEIDSIWKHEVLPYITERFFGDPDKAIEFELEKLKKNVKVGSEAVNDNTMIEDPNAPNDTMANEED